MELPFARPPDFHCRIKVESHLSKKNSRPIHTNRTTGKPFIGKGARLRAMEQWVILHLLKARQEKSGHLPIRGPVAACFRFYFSDYYRNDGYPRETMPDLSNLLELPQDALQAAGIIVNDNQVFSLDGSRRLPGKENVLEVFLWVDDTM